MSDDLILGTGENLMVWAGAGDDTAAGGFGKDVILGQNGDGFLLGIQGNDVLHGNEGLDTFVSDPGDTDPKSGASTADTATDFASIQALAQPLIDGGDAYAFVADGTDGHLFATVGAGTAVTASVGLARDRTAEALTYKNVGRGPVAWDACRGRLAPTPAGSRRGR